MQLYLIRHGQSVNNANWDRKDQPEYERYSDPPLTELGVRQAQSLAQFIASTRSPSEKIQNVGEYRHSINITHLYSSLMIRAVHTGTIISETLGLPLVALPVVHEVGGVYLKTKVDGVTEISFEHGVSPAYLQENFPALQLDQPIEEKGWWQGGQEPVTDLLSRTKRALQFIEEQHLGTDDKVAIVTHGGFFNYMVRTLFSIRLDEQDNRNLPFWFSFCNCAISRFDFVEERVTLIYHNRTDFMDEELISC